MSLSAERYVLFTSFRADGSPVSTPVWLVDLGDDEIGFWTSSESGKAKRLRHSTRVTVQACNGRGVVTPGSEPIEGAARLVAGPELRLIRERVIAKYGFQTKLAKWAATSLGLLRRQPRPYGDRGVIVRLPPGS